MRIRMVPMESGPCEPGQTVELETILLSEMEVSAVGEPKDFVGRFEILSFTVDGVELAHRGRIRGSARGVDIRARVRNLSDADTYRWFATVIGKSEAAVVRTIEPGQTWPPQEG